MKKFFHNSLLISVGVAAAALSSTACGGGTADDDSTGGTAGTGGTGGGTCMPGGNIVLAVDSSGWMDMTTPCNDDVAVQGSWYPYGDSFDVAKCTAFGGHMASECASITTPDPLAMAFPNTNGAMHTAGTVEKVLPCVAGSMAYTTPTSGCPDFDYSSMWGAGIGFDLSADKGEDGGAKHTWNPKDHAVVGIRFTIDAVPAPGLRVEFPMILTAEEAANDTPVAVTSNPPTTDDHSKGAPYWGAQKNGDNKWPNSPVMMGVNTIIFDTDVQPPVMGPYVFDQARMLGVQFHVPTTSTAGGTYDFTISKFTLLRDPNQP